MSVSFALKKEGVSLSSEVARDKAVTRPSKKNSLKSCALVLDQERKDFLIERDGERYAGAHLLIDLKNASRLDDIAYIDTVIRDCVTAAGATLLHIHLHHFTPNGGVSGVAVLAESHISIHTWPEHGFAALDVFMCGAAHPHKTIYVLRHAFKPSEVVVEERLRGLGL